MAHRSAQPPKPRGRPRLVSENEETLLRTMGWAHGFSRHDRTNTVHRLRAIRQFITDARFAWLCSDVAPNGDPQDNRGHLRRTILTELGRIEEEDVREQLALHLCETKPTTREAVAMIRHYRLGTRPPGTAEQLTKAWCTTLLEYLVAHPDLEWEDIQRAVLSLAQLVDRMEMEGD
jgi:hypothetical protein